MQEKSDDISHEQQYSRSQNALNPSAKRIFAP